MGCSAHLMLLWVGNSNLFVVVVCIATVLTAEPFPQLAHMCFKVNLLKK